MKASELVTSWTTRDNKRLTNRQFSVRLPVHIAARIAGLCDMFPKKHAPTLWLICSIPPWKNWKKVLVITTQKMMKLM